MKPLNDERNGTSLWTPWRVGIGASRMYFVDPLRGARRRALLCDKAAHAANLTVDGLAATTRDISHRVQGTWASTRTWLQPGAVSDEVLVERVRATLGRYVSHPHAIDVCAQNGCIELRGKILKREVDPLLHAVRSLPGVCDIDNLLEEHESPGNIPSLQGGISRRGDRYEVMQANWTPAVRIAVGSIGSALASYGAARRDLAGAFFASAGVALIVRAGTNLQATRLVGVGAGHRAIDIQKTVHINATVGMVFDFWSHFENFPSFMRHVRDVRPTAIDGQSHWTVSGPGSIPVEFDAVITDFVPNQLLAWKTVEGAPVAHAGLVRFDPEGELGTRVHIRFSYNPPGGAIGHALVSLLGSDPKTRMDEDLTRMKTLIETGNPPRDAAQPMPQAPAPLM